MPSKTTPTFLNTARAFYGPAFDHKRKKALARSMAEWAEMDEDEQSFALAHLAFLDLQAQAGTQRLLVQVRDLLDEVAESLSVALEASLPDEEEPEPQDVPDDELEDAFDFDELPEPAPIPEPVEPDEDLAGNDDDQDDDDSDDQGDEPDEEG